MSTDLVPHTPAAPVDMSTTSWEPNRQLSFDEWEQQGERLGVMGRASQWWLGDWLNYGEAAYGEKYSQADAITGLDADTICKYAEIAARVPKSVRVDGLSWSHHREVAYLDPADRDALLAEARESQSTVAQLVSRVKALKAPPPQATLSGEPLAAWRTQITFVHEAASDKEATDQAKAIAQKLERMGAQIRHKSTVPA